MKYKIEEDGFKKELTLKELKSIYEDGVKIGDIVNMDGSVVGSFGKFSNFLNEQVQMHIETGIPVDINFLSDKERNIVKEKILLLTYKLEQGNITLEELETLCTLKYKTKFVKAKYPYGFIMVNTVECCDKPSQMSWVSWGKANTLIRKLNYDGSLDQHSNGRPITKEYLMRMLDYKKPFQLNKFLKEIESYGIIKEVSSKDKFRLLVNPVYFNKGQYITSEVYTHFKKDIVKHLTLKPEQIMLLEMQLS